MIRVNILEEFPIVSTLIDGYTGRVYFGETVFYDVRQQPDDIPLVPTMSGILPESISTPGIYTKTEIINTPGNYIVYCSCNGFDVNAEEIIVVPKAVNYMVPEIKSDSFTYKVRFMANGIDLNDDIYKVKFNAKTLKPVIRARSLLNL